MIFWIIIQTIQTKWLKIIIYIYKKKETFDLKFGTKSRKRK